MLAAGSEAEPRSLKVFLCILEAPDEMASPGTCWGPSPAPLHLGRLWINDVIRSFVCVRYSLK